MTFEHDLPEDTSEAAVVLVSGAWRSYISTPSDLRLGDPEQYEQAIVNTLRELGYTAVQAEELNMFARLSAELELMPSEVD